MFTVTVILPTLGRESLMDSIESILRDSQVIKIIVIVAQEDYLNTKRIMSRFIDDLDIRVCLKEVDSRSISKSFNLGLSLIDTDYFTFFSDDDIWIRGRTQAQLNFLEANPKISAHLGYVNFQKSDSSIIRPEKIIRASVTDVLNNKWWMRGEYYVSLTSFLGRKELSSIRFRENLKFWEDISWLIDIENNGFVFMQTYLICSDVKMGYSRGASRESSEQYITICTEVLKNNRRNSSRFLANLAIKNHIYSGNPQNIWQIYKVGINLELGFQFTKKTFGFFGAILISYFRKIYLFLKN